MDLDQSFDRLRVIAKEGAAADGTNLSADLCSALVEILDRLEYLEGKTDQD